MVSCLVEQVARIYDRKENNVEGGSKSHQLAYNRVNPTTRVSLAGQKIRERKKERRIKISQASDEETVIRSKQ